jgi:hypothetical protein
MSPPLDDAGGMQPAPGTGWTGLVDPEPQPNPGDLVVSVPEDGKGVTVKIHQPPRPKSLSDGFDENLAERPELSNQLSSIAEDILEGIDADLASRQGFIDNWIAGQELLGTMIETRSDTKGQKRNVSRVRDTTMLENIVRAQSQARRELLPAAGPCKVEEMAGSDEQDDDLAADFTTDFNYILTKGMPEFVPGLDRGLFGFFYSGNMFRYGYHDPMSRRPKVETYPTEDVIVSEEATDLDTATRVTLRIPEMSPGEAKRRQFYGLWRQVDLMGSALDISPELQKKQEMSGVRNMGTRQKDQPLCIYQTIVDLDLSLMGLEEKDAPEGLMLPYKVTTDKSSRQVVRIERYWRQDDPLFLRKRRLVHYSMVPGFAFLAYGFLHLQGNQVKALTSIVRLLIDAMMFGCFPGGVKAKGIRTETNEINPGPGEWADLGVPAGMDDIRKALMPLPYKDLSPVSIQFYNLLQQACQRVGAAAMMETGEGRTNMPVGTIMAMLEEKSTVMSAIHARMHEAMARELSMVREMFLERPESFSRVLPNPRRSWAAMTEFSNLNLIPASDPNVPSQVHRIMLATALATLLGMPGAQQLLDPVDILKRVLRMIGISDPEKAMKDPATVAQQNQPEQDPVVAAAQATLQAKQMDVTSKQEENQRKAAESAVEAEGKAKEAQQVTADNQLDRASKERIAAMKEETEHLKLVAEEQRSQRQESNAANVGGGMQPAQPRTFGGSQF